MKTKKTLLLVIATLVVVVLAISGIVACTKATYDTIIIGSSTELSGDFRWPGIGSSSANATDQDVSKLTTGYSTMEINRGGAYVWNDTAVKSKTEEEIANSDGTKNFKITVELNKGLKMSNGEEVKASNYLAYALAMSTPVAEDAFGLAQAGNAIVGFDTFSAYNGTNAGEKATKELKGLRLLGDYKFSIEISSEFYPYYYADTYGLLTPYDSKLVLGDGVSVKDDGNGAYLDGNWYEKKGDEYKKVAHLKAARYDTSKYAFTGAYTIEKWDESKKEVTLALNKNYKGNFEGQKGSIPKIVIRKVVAATQINSLKNGEVDILEGLTGGESVNAALAMAFSTGHFKENHYDRAGYGKVQFDCDFGPTMFAEVRQAVAYSLDRPDFANTFLQGYGSVVSAPYSVNFDAAITLGDSLANAIKDYAVSADNAKKVLVDGGWTYTSTGENKGANWTAGTGADAVRYKKLSASEYGPNNVNQTYQGVTSEGVSYKTLKVGNDYYMPLVINWFSTEDNEVSELLTTKLKTKDSLKTLGMLITKTEGSFPKLIGEIKRLASQGYGGTPQYGMFNLATGWNTAMYDYAFNWVDKADPEYAQYFGYSSNKLSDPYDAAFKWADKSNKNLTYDEAVAKSGGKLGMNYLSQAMVYSVKPGDVDEYNKWFKAYMIRWNELLPDIPLYSNIYYDVYNSSKLDGLQTGPFWNAAQELLYQKIK